jgi:hypothetical protein
MGKLHYVGNIAVEFEDRALAHLQIVIAAKLRRNEALFFSWNDDASHGHGRTMIWLHPSIPLSFKFYGSKAPVINRAWVDKLMVTANSSAGLRLIEEPSTPTAG